jgi:NADH dehydrogenase
MDQRHHVVIIGGGFAGLQAALALRKAPVQITLVDRRNFHLFQPLLYQVAMGGLSPANIATPLRALFKNQKNAEVFLAEAVDFDLAGKRVLLSDGELTYDTLIVAAGTRDHYFGHDDWEKLAPGLKSIEDATEIRRRVLLAFEAAERATDPEKRQALLTFVIIGGGPTGVELSGALGELAHHTLRNNFRHIRPSDARIILVEGMDRVLPPYPPKLSVRAAASLAELGVTVRTGTVVTDLKAEAVTVRTGDQTETILSHTVLWAAGVRASPLGPALAKAANVVPDRAGRVPVQPDLTVAGHPQVFVLGDLASCPDQTGKPLPGVAPVAMQQGRYVADLIRRRLAGKDRSPFRYHDKGKLATIGRSAAVADLGFVQLSGFFAWLIWLFVHLLYLVGFQNRLLVLMQWAWNYITRNRSARLVTGESPFPLSRPAIDLSFSPEPAATAAQHA